MAEFSEDRTMTLFGVGGLQSPSSLRAPTPQLASSAVAPTEKGAVWVHELPNLEPKDSGRRV